MKSEIFKILGQKIHAYPWKEQALVVQRQQQRQWI